MKLKGNKTNEDLKQTYQITEKGSLGILANGDVGLRQWRKVKKEFFKKDSE